MEIRWLGHACFTILPDMEPQIAVLKFLGLSEAESGRTEKKPSLLARAAAKLSFSK